MIVDGYNLIAHQTGLQGGIEQKRRRLVDELSRYRRVKGLPVTVVFDGWQSEWESEHEERIGGVSVIYSRRGEKADAVIARLASRLGSACLVVTSDREVQRAAQACGATPVFADEFERRLAAALSAKARGGESEPVVEDPQDKPMRPNWSRKKGNPFKRSKADRRRRSKLEKL